MIGFAWLTLRQAQEALKNGRLEDAQRLLCSSCAQGHKRSWDLLRELARKYVERGENHLGRNDPEAAWHDLLRAEQVGVTEVGTEKLRQALVCDGLIYIRGLMQDGEPQRAAEAISQLRDRSVRHPDLEHLEEAAKNWCLAKEHAGRGDFSQALHTVERVKRLLTTPNTALNQFAAELETRRRDFTGVLGQLHTAADQGRWREVVDISEKVLSAAPNHPEARKARARAWKAIEPTTVAADPIAAVLTPPPIAAKEPASHRFLLWIDGVGSYLVCLGSRVKIGQALPDSFVDIPLYADVSREHAVITRDSEGYLLTALRPLQINSKPTDRALLHPNDRITLGSSCQVQFRQPVPVSATARLDMASGHRLPISVDGVLLMADTLVLGPGTHVHIALPDVKQAIVLFRNKEGLGIRYPGKFTIDGQPCAERGTLGPTSTVVGDDFAFSLETLEAKLKTV